jgi:ferric-dicitrate binding protein FerR (iron transport regulator)
MLAAGLALALEFLNPAIRTADQLERQLGVQPVIVVPRLQSRRTRRRRRRGLVALVLGMAALLWAGLRYGGLILAEAGRLLGFGAARPV